jgi:hypothetical protein
LTAALGREGWRKRTFRGVRKVTIRFSQIHSVVFIFVLVCYLADVHAVAVTEGLVAWYTFDGDVENDAGSGNGTVFNGVSYEDGVFGQAVRLNGFDDYIVLPGTSGLSFGSGDFSVSFWFNSYDYWGRILDERIGREQGYVFALRSVDDSPTEPANISFAAQNGLGVGTKISTVETTLGWLNDGNWHHVVGVREGSEHLLYIDGDLAISDDSDSGDIGGANDIYVGRRYEITHPDATTEAFYDGLLDDLSFYNRSLTQEQVSEIYAESVGIPNPNTAYLMSSGLLLMSLVGQRGRSSGQAA